MAKMLKNTLMMLLVLSSLVACAKKEGGRAARTSGANTGVGASPFGGATGNCAPNGQSVGRVYDDGTASGYSFEQRVKGLISALVNPEYFGAISGDPNAGANGVTIEGHLSYDANGNVLLDQTHLMLLVYDSYVGQKDSDGKLVEAYPIKFPKAAAGSVNLQTKAFTVQFKDSYGEMTVTGSLQSNLVTGHLTYQNSTSFDGGAPSAGALGAFTIPTCAWIN